MPHDRWTWKRSAYCVKINPTALSSSGSKGDTSYITRDLCRTCPVRATCLGWALVTNVPAGVRGGLSSAQRRTLRARLLQCPGGRPMAGSPELAALVRAFTAPVD